MSPPEPISTFVQQMQALLDQRSHATSRAEKRQAEQAMTDLLRRQHARPEPFDSRMAQAGRDDE